MRLVRATAATATAGLVLAAVSTITGGPAGASAPAGDGPPARPGAGSLLPAAAEILHFPEGKDFALDSSIGAAARRFAATRRPAARPGAVARTPEVGTSRPWLSLDIVNGSVYAKDYTLRGVGENIEVWVASGAHPTDGVTGTAFPAGDCRTVVPDSTTVTDGQVQDLIREFDETMLPEESKQFSVAPGRDGTDPTPNPMFDGLDFTGDPGKVVTLVDNVRDPNFYDFPANRTYIAGFFSQQFNALTDRNVMTIDAFDWEHRTGENPADEPDEDLCRSRPARSRLYEGVFAHEYQHLLQSYTDPAEVNFINEGLSDVATSLVGYARSRASVFQRGAESHLYCWHGFGTTETPFNPNPQACGGPQNSLTVWGDEGDGSEILADYGTAWSFLLFLRDRYGDEIIRFLHRDGKHRGLAAVRAALARHGDGASLKSVLRDYQLMTLVDRVVDVERGTIAGVAEDRVTTPSLSSTINLLNPASHIAAGAAPNGADYVLLRGRGSTPLAGDRLRSLSFAGRRLLDTVPLAWTVAPRVPVFPPVALPPVPGAPPPPPITLPEPPPSPADDPALFSGNTPNTDAAAVVRVRVPESNPTLSYESLTRLEAGFDYGYTVISTDGGRTYRNLGNANTVPAQAPAPPGPALTGDSGVPVTQTFDLSEFAGREVVLGFRFRSDAAVDAGGWYVDDVRVGDRLISDGSTTEPLRSFSQIRPVKVANWGVQIVGLDERGHRAAVRRIDGKYGFSLDADQLARFASYPVVVAIVGYDEPTDRLPGYAPYELKVNGVVQPGGSGDLAGGDLG